MMHGAPPLHSLRLYPTWLMQQFMRYIVSRYNTAVSNWLQLSLSGYLLQCGDVTELLSVLKEAKASGLKLSLHLAEVLHVLCNYMQSSCKVLE